MALHNRIEELSRLQNALEKAADEFDWNQVKEVDLQVRKLVSTLTPEERKGEMAFQLAALKASYKAVLESSEERRAVLQKKMGKLRNNRGAVNGYKTSLAAGNKEVRLNA